MPEIIVGIVGGGGLTQIANLFASRTRAQAYAQGAVDRAMKSVSEQLARADERLSAMELHRDECEAELEQGRRNQLTLQRQLDALMAGPIANYGEAK
jgi:tetraacyldisaccharide-1-P 4'-kinase